LVFRKVNEFREMALEFEAAWRADLAALGRANAAARLRAFLLS
jgi:hypothetical protein